MSDDTITVSVNENPTINLEITTYTNEADVSFIQPKGDTGDKGDSAYVYIAYASDSSGTGFTTTFNSSLDYIAVLNTDTEITSLTKSHFSGLWKNYKGDTGATYDWSGTSAEFTAARSAGTITEGMVCYITDESSVIDLSDYATTTALTSGLADKVDTTTFTTYQTSVTSALSGKVDTVSGKDLSTNDLTDTLKSNYDTAYTDAHTHSNSTALNNVAGTNTGDETSSTIKTKLGSASTSTDGYLTSSDYTTFNNKQSALTAGTDYLTPSGSGANLTSLNASNIASGTIGSSYLPTATTSALGAVKPDGSTITISNGVISSSGSGTNYGASCASVCLTGTAVTTTTSSTPGTYTGISSSYFTSHVNSGFTASNGVLTCTTAGTYLFIWSGSVYCTTAAKSMGWGIMLTSTIQTMSICRTYESTASTYYSASGMGINTFVVGDTLQLATTNYTTASMTNGIINGGFIVVRIY